jgi:hypothetical protein
MKYLIYIQEREIRTDRDIQEFKTERMSQEDRTLETKKEQTRLLKNICLPKRKLQLTKSE